MGILVEFSTEGLMMADVFKLQVLLEPQSCLNWSSWLSSNPPQWEIAHFMAIHWGKESRRDKGLWLQWTSNGISHKARLLLNLHSLWSEGITRHFCQKKVFHKQKVMEPSLFFRHFLRRLLLFCGHSGFVFSDLLVRFDLQLITQVCMTSFFLRHICDEHLLSCGCFSSFFSVTGHYFSVCECVVMSRKGIF